MSQVHESVGIFIKLKIKDANSDWNKFITSLVSKVKDLGNPNLYEYYINGEQIDLHERFPDNDAWIKRIDFFSKNVVEDFLNLVEIQDLRVYGPVNDEIK